MPNQPSPRTAIRAAVLGGFAELVRKLGGDPAALLTKAGLDVRALIEPDMLIDGANLIRVLELAAIETSTEDFGLRLAQMHGIGNLGPIGLLAREEPDVGTAVKTLISFFYLHNRAVHIRLDESGALAVLTISLAGGEPSACRQATELMMGATVGVLRAFLGAEWSPLRIHLAHDAPKKRDTHRRFFRTLVEFNQPTNAVLCLKEDLKRPIGSSNPEFERHVRHWVESLAAHTLSEHEFAADVRRLIPVLLSSGCCSAERLASYYGIDRRTVHRKLQQSGQTFSELVNAVRRDLARHRVAEAQLNLGEIADMLGFAHLSGFSRWFHGEFGMSPRQWRLKQNKAHP